MRQVIVKADDAGVALARTSHGLVRGLGRGIVLGMPVFLRWLSFVGMVAMLWVGGGILLHGLHELGVHGPEAAVKQAAAAVAGAVPVMKSAVAWIVSAGIAGILGVGVGAVVAPLTERVLVPALGYVKKRLRPAPGG